MEINLNEHDRNLYLSGIVDIPSISAVIEKIIKINQDDEKFVKICEMNSCCYQPKPIKIYIDSFGGSVYQCLGLISVIEKSKTPVHTICTGVAMSAGFMLLISGHRRFGHRLSTFLYHQLSSVTFGELKGIENDVNELKRLQEILEIETLTKTSISKKRLVEVYEKKIDWFISSKEALELNIIDEII